MIDISKDRYDEIMSMDWKNCRLIFDEEIIAIHDGKVLEQEPCEDCVSREEAILVMCGNCADWQTCKMNCIRVRAIRNREKLPSVTLQEPKTGRWIEHFDESGKWYECDQCHTDWGGSVNYCPNCGAKMQEGGAE